METKAREFWLDLATKHGDPCDFVSEGSLHERPSSTNIHVIEYSAYEELQKCVEQLEAEVKRLHDKYDFQLLVKSNERMREALKQIRHHVVGHKGNGEILMVIDEALGEVEK